jgi:hypothetical protein
VRLGRTVRFNWANKRVSEGHLRARSLGTSVVSGIHLSSSLAGL